MTKNSCLVEQNDAVTKLNFSECFPISMIFSQFKFQGNKFQVMKYKEQWDVSDNFGAVS